MALQNFQYDTIMREYSRRQSEVQRALEERRREAYSKVPRLLEIDQEVASLSARKARALLLGQPASIEELRQEVAALAKERISLLKASTVVPSLEEEVPFQKLYFVCFFFAIF